MKTAVKYRRHAYERRILANQIPEWKQRNQLLEMVRTWNNSTTYREQLDRTNPELDTLKNPTNSQAPQFSELLFDKSVEWLRAVPEMDHHESEKNDAHD
jgi:hypothetical protein